MKRSHFHYFIFCLIILLGSCKQAVLDGHWHVSTERDAEFYITLDFLEDSICYLNHNSFWNAQDGVLDNKKNKIYINNKKGIAGYAIKNRTENEMQLMDLHDGTSFYASKCEEQCCNVLEDYLKEIFVKIELPENVYNFKLEKITRANSAYIFYGVPNSDYNKAFGNDVLLCIDNQFTTEYTLPFYHENKLKQFKEEEINYKIIADKKTRIKQLKNAVQELNKLGIHQVYISTNFDKTEKIKDPFNYINSNKLDFSKEKMEWGNYLKENTDSF